MSQKAAFNYEVRFNGNQPEAWAIADLVADYHSPAPTFRGPELAAVIQLQMGESWKGEGVHVRRVEG